MSRRPSNTVYYTGACRIVQRRASDLWPHMESEPGGRSLVWAAFEANPPQGETPILYATAPTLRELYGMLPT